MKRGGLLNKHICGKKSNISNETAETVNFYFSHCKSMGTISCHSNQSSYPARTKNTIICSPTYRCYMCNMKRIGFMVSEEKLFENVDDGRTDDGYLSTRNTTNEIQ